MEHSFHPTVFKCEAVALLQVQPGRVYLDATVGGGGHAGEIIRQGGRVVGIDQDQDALDYSREYLAEVSRQTKQSDAFRLVKGNFARLSELYPLDTKPSGIVFDLGASWYQLTTGERGFSFGHDGPLDMRMDRQLGVTAADLVNKLTIGDLAYLLSRYGDEKLAKPIAAAVMRQRTVKPLATTGELARLVERVYQDNRRKPGKIHPATKTFQALRIAVNSEMENLAAGLKQAIELLTPGGRLVLISFQPAEDRLAVAVLGPAVKAGQMRKIGQPYKMDWSEAKKQPNGRSALLRAWEKQ